MSVLDHLQDVGVEIDDHVALVEIRRGPHNFFDVDLIRELGDVFHALDEDPECRAIVLASEGKSFCAGANLGGSSGTSDAARHSGRGSGHLYQEGVRLFEAEIPVVAAIQGAAIGGGLGLALMADLRVGCSESRFAANFSRLGFHQGFGLTVTLPALVGQQRALDLFYTGRRVKGDEAHKIGLCDYYVLKEDLRDKAREVATEIARSAPLAIRSIRHTMRGHLASQIREATDHELIEQTWLRQTDDFKEGVAAMTERRLPNFQGS